MAKKYYTNLDMGSASKVINLPTATGNGDAVPLAQLNTAISNAALTVAAGSTNYLDITGGELSIKSLAITSVTTDATNNTIADFVADFYADGDEFQASDVVILPGAAAGSKVWMHNGGTAGTDADFTAIDSVLDSATVRGFVDAGDGLDYNSSTGVFSIGTGEVVESMLSTAVQTKLNADAAHYESATAFDVTADTWHRINHALNHKYVQTAIYNSDDELIELDIKLIDANNVDVRSNTSLTGLKANITG